VCFLLGLSEEVMPLSALTRQTGLSEKYLEQLLAMLKKAGIVAAKRGSYGGYMLTKPAEEITVDQMLTALEDNFEITDCIKGVCSDEYCPNRGLFTKLYKDISGLLTSTTLQDFINDSMCKPRGAIGE